MKRLLNITAILSFIFLTATITSCGKTLISNNTTKSDNVSVSNETFPTKTTKKGGISCSL